MTRTTPLIAAIVLVLTAGSTMAQQTARYADNPFAAIPRAAAFDPTIGILRCTNPKPETGDEFICRFRLSQFNAIAGPVFFLGSLQYEDGKTQVPASLFTPTEVCNRGFCYNGIEQNFEGVVYRQRIGDLTASGTYRVTIGLRTASGVTWQATARYDVNQPSIGLDADYAVDSVSEIGKDDQGQHMLVITGVFPTDFFRVWVGTGNQYGPSPILVRSNNGRTAVFTFPRFAESVPMDLVAMFDGWNIHSTLQKGVLLSKKSTGQ